MNDGKVETLRNLALKCSFYSLKSAIDRLPNLEKWPLNDCYSVIEQKLEDYENWKQVKEIVKYHRPYREFLSAAKKYGDYFKMVNFDSHLDNNRDKFHFSIFWLCYENEETVKFDSNIGNTNPTMMLHALMKKFQIKMLKCKEALLWLYLNHGEPDFENARDLLKRMPNIEDLNIRISARISCRETNDFMEKIFAEEISAFNHLTTLSTALRRSEFYHFSVFVKNSPKTLKKLQIYDSSVADCVELKIFLESIRQLHNLKILNIDIPFMQKIIENFDDHIVITSVRSMKLWIYSMKSLIFVDKFFNGVEGLTIVYREPFERMSRQEKSAIESSLCEMTTLQMINSLNLFYDEDVLFPIALPTLWKIFPNVTTFSTFRIDANEKDLDFTEVSIEKLVVLSGKIRPPHILSKMPNLKEIIFRKSLTRCDFSEATRTLKPFLPKDCRILVSDSINY